MCAACGYGLIQWTGGSCSTCSRSSRCRRQPTIWCVSRRRRGRSGARSKTERRGQDSGSSTPAWRIPNSLSLAGVTGTTAGGLGYIAAGGGPKWSGALKRLKPGDRVFAYVSKAGYVGYGTVSRAAAPVHLFTLTDGRSLDDHLNGAWNNSKRNEEEWEYAAGIDWVSTFAIDEARSSQGAFANPNAMCKLRHPETLEFLVKEFQVESDSISPPTEFNALNEDDR